MTTHSARKFIHLESEFLMHRGGTLPRWIWPMRPGVN